MTHRVSAPFGRGSAICCERGAAPKLSRDRVPSGRGAVPGRTGERGLTLVELIVAFTILSLLAGMSVPLVRYKVRRDRERELLYALREIHKAIDDYKDAANANKFQVKLGTEGYPESLKQLVEGVTLSGSADGKKIKFLRRIPIDPMTGTTDWGLRSMQDDPTSTSWGGQNVFSVYTKSLERARDGTQYKDW